MIAGMYNGAAGDYLDSMTNLLQSAEGERGKVYLASQPASSQGP